MVNIGLILEVSGDVIHLCSGWNCAIGLKEYASSIATRIPRNIREIIVFPLGSWLVLILLIYSCL